MQSPEVLTYKPIMLTWLDSEATPGWQYAPQVKPQESKIHSIGWLIKETETAVMISTSVSENNGVMDALTIPKVAIVKRSDYPDGKQE